jgi:hypothetical protein
MTLHSETKRRLLTAAGFVHVSGWVRAEDAPAIERKIAEARAVVDALVKEAE